MSELLGIMMASSPMIIMGAILVYKAVKDND